MAAEGNRESAVHVRLPFSRTAYGVPVERRSQRASSQTRHCRGGENAGVRAIFHRENIGKNLPLGPGTGFEGITTSGGRRSRMTLCAIYGQYVALAVADTFEAAKAAADAVRVTYAKERPNVEYGPPKATTNRMFVRLHSPRLRVCKASAASPRALLRRASQARPNVRSRHETHQPPGVARHDRGLGDSS